jgi:hypothetical protein
MTPPQAHTAVTAPPPSHHRWHRARLSLPPRVSQPPPPRAPRPLPPEFLGHRRTRTPHPNANPACSDTDTRHFHQAPMPTPSVGAPRTATSPWQPLLDGAIGLQWRWPPFPSLITCGVWNLNEIWWNLTEFVIVCRNLVNYVTVCRNSNQICYCLQEFEWN